MQDGSTNLDTDEAKEAARRYLKQTENPEGFNSLIRKAQEISADSKSRETSPKTSDALKSHQLASQPQSRVLKFTSEEFRRLMATMGGEPTPTKVPQLEKEPPIDTSAPKKPTTERQHPFLTVQFDLERDKELYVFINEFYKRYTMLYYSDSEKEKAAKLKVKVKIQEQKTLSFTRNEFDDYITSFRNVYKSYCNLRTFIGKDEIHTFDSIYSLKTFHLLNIRYSKKLSVNRIPAFTLHWLSPSGTSMIVDSPSLEYLTGQLFPRDSLAMIKDRVMIGDEDEVDVLAMLVHRNTDFVEFMLKLNMIKLEKLVKATQSQSEK